MSSFEIRWTATAREGLAALPPKVRRGILDKASELRNAAEPAVVYKPLRGPLEGYYRIPYSRYRAIFTIQHEGQSVVAVILFVAVGVRKEGDKKDIYRLAQKLLELGIIQPAHRRRK